MTSSKNIESAMAFLAKALKEAPDHPLHRAVGKAFSLAASVVADYSTGLVRIADYPYRVSGWYRPETNEILWGEVTRDQVPPQRENVSGRSCDVFAEEKFYAILFTEFFWKGNP